MSEISTRDLINLRFSYAASLSRALYTLNSHQVFGACPPTIKIATELAHLYLDEILLGLCPVVNPDVSNPEVIGREENISFHSNYNACIDAFQTVIMDKAARETLLVEYTNRDLNNISTRRQLLETSTVALDAIVDTNTCDECGDLSCQH